MTLGQIYTYILLLYFELFHFFFLFFLFIIFDRAKDMVDVFKNHLHDAIIRLPGLNYAGTGTNQEPRLTADGLKRSANEKQRQRNLNKDKEKQVNVYRFMISCVHCHIFFYFFF